MQNIPCISMACSYIVLILFLPINPSLIKYVRTATLLSTYNKIYIAIRDIRLLAWIKILPECQHWRIFETITTFYRQFWKYSSTVILYYFGQKLQKLARNETMRHFDLVLLTKQKPSFLKIWISQPHVFGVDGVVGCTLGC